MNLTNKIIFLQKSMNLSDREFCINYKIKGSSLRKWKSGASLPSKEDVMCLCRAFNLDIDDFISDLSTVSYVDLKEGEHPCKLNPQKNDRTDIILEDFAREDNSRYEEKD